MAIYERMKVQGRGGALPTYQGRGKATFPDLESMPVFPDQTPACLRPA